MSILTNLVIISIIIFILIITINIINTFLYTNRFWLGK